MFLSLFQIVWAALSSHAARRKKINIIKSCIFFNNNSELAMCIPSASLLYKKLFSYRNMMIHWFNRTHNFVVSVKSCRLLKIFGSRTPNVTIICQSYFDCGLIFIVYFKEYLGYFKLLRFVNTILDKWYFRSVVFICKAFRVSFFSYHCYLWNTFDTGELKSLGFLIKNL